MNDRKPTMQEAVRDLQPAGIRSGSLSTGAAAHNSTPETSLYVEPIWHSGSSTAARICPETSFA